LRLTETLNDTYAAEVELELVCENPTVQPTEMLGSNATLTLERDRCDRQLRGIIDRVETLTVTNRLVRAKVRVVPALAALRHRVDSRIFQEKTVKEILESVLAEGLQPYSERTVNLDGLRREYPKREYTVQYEESDYDFCCRLMEEEGISFYFKHDDEHEVLHLVDANDAYEAVETIDGNPVPYVHVQGNHPDAEPIVRFQPRTHMGANAVTLNDRDWTNVANIGDMALDSIEGPSREHYEHRTHLTIGDYNEDKHAYMGQDLDKPRLRMEQLRARDHVVSGTGQVIRFRPGLTFELSGHPDSGVDGRYVILSTLHQGVPEDEDLVDQLADVGRRQGEPYHNTFDCIPIDVPYRPARRTRKPRIHGVETATVVGINGQEIYCDHHGRIKVHFHWDRLAERDENRSCYIRVGQSWAGNGWGAQFLPRIGMEVIVTFLKGDPDRPLVTGCVYNGLNELPYNDFPADMTKSGWKTRSSLGGEGYNEICFEDAKDGEQIIIHAQKDFNEAVLNNHSTTVGANNSNSVGGSQSISVSGNRTVDVTKNQTTTITEARTTTVVKDDTTVVHGKSDLAVVLDARVNVQGMMTEEFLKNRNTTVGGDDKETVDGKKVVGVIGNYETTSTGAYAVTQNGTSQLILNGQASITSDGHAFVACGEQTYFRASPGGKARIEASSELVLNCGGASIKLKADGTVEISGTVKVAMTAGGSSVEVAPAGVTTTGTGINSTATGTHQIVGALVLIN